MRIEDRKGQPLTEATLTVDDDELIDLLQGLADVVEGTREHLHFSQLGGAQLVVRRTAEADTDPLQRSMDWWMGPVILVAIIFLVVGGATVIRWAAGLLS